MAAASPARIAANRANAQRSSGPKTETGKARSCRNAVKHGLSGRGVGLTAEDQALTEHRRTCWTEELGARGDLESVLVADAATASVLMRRTYLDEAERVARRLDDRRVRLRPRVERDRDIAAARLAQWSDAADQFAATRRLDSGTIMALFTALGVDLAKYFETKNPEALALRDRLARAEGAPTVEARRQAASELDTWLTHRRDEARREVERIEARLAKLEDPESAWFDASPEAEKVRRYRAAAERTLHRSLDRLARIRRLPDSPFVAEDEATARNEPKTDDLATTYDESHAVEVPPETVSPAGDPESTVQEPETPADASALSADRPHSSRNEPKTDDVATTSVDLVAAPPRSSFPGAGNPMLGSPSPIGASPVHCRPMRQDDAPMGPARGRMPRCDGSRS